MWHGCEDSAVVTMVCQYMWPTSPEIQISMIQQNGTSKLLDPAKWYVEIAGIAHAKWMPQVLPLLTHTSHRTPMLGFRSCLTDWNLFLTGWTLFLSGWLSKPLIHTTEFQTSHLSPHTLHFRLRISHPNSHFQTSISHLKDLRPAT